MKEKRYMNLDITYAVLAMLFGVFYREFTKFNLYSGETTLSFIHTHYFMLGMVFFLVLMILQRLYAFSNTKTTKAIIAYQVGLNITVVGFLLRGIPQVLGSELSSAFNASISGISGIGHIILGISLLMILWNVRNAVSKKQS